MNLPMCVEYSSISFNQNTINAKYSNISNKHGTNPGLKSNIGPLLIDIAQAMLKTEHKLALTDGPALMIALIVLTLTSTFMNKARLLKFLFNSMF